MPMTDKKECKQCPDGQVMRDGRCVMPAVNFAAFLMSLKASALFHLGEISEPTTGAKNKDLVLAQHTIDSLSLLRDKTKGNLTDEESDQLKHTLYELKMLYVKASSATTES